MKPVARGKGRSAVAAVAYRAAEKLTNERDGITHDFTHKKGVEHSEIVLPEGVSADWARDRSALWNAAEKAEARKDARVAREFEIALPHELTAEQRLEAAQEFAQDLANRYGAAVDFAIHAPNGDTDIRNHHAHVMMTTRQVTADGLGDKTYIERENKWLLSNDLPTSHMQLRDIRQSWEQMANERLAMAGLDIRIDHRSHSERGLELVPTEHMGVHATQMERRGQDVDRARLDAEAAQRNAEIIREKPEQVLTLISGEKSVFDRHDIARVLHRYINDDIGEFRDAFAKVMASPALVELQAERADPATGEIELARYSTREMVGIESGLAVSAERLHQAQTHGVDRQHVDRAIGAQDAAIQRSAGDASARLSDEQRSGIEHITGPERIAAVVGYAGAGKSTMLAAAREAWEAEGYTVHGAALSGKAAEGLEESSGIRSRTLASWSRGWDNDRSQLNRGDVFVIDEAGMVGSRQLARFVGEAEARGAKIVLVGDHEQLQAIGAGAPFRAIAEQIGHAELSEIRRQRVDWQRAASVSFATHKTAEGLAAYRDNGNIRLSDSQDGARSEIVRDYLADRDERPEGTRVAMAHRRADVRAINDGIRSALQERGALAQGDAAGEILFQTNDGKRAFAPGDRIVFLENNRDLGVKNGMLGTVESVEAGRSGAGPMMVAQLDGKSDTISIAMGEYQAIDHGYATTIHKNQGATVDRAFVLASGTMDRHLTYVAMTRHRDGAQLYAGMDEFTGRRADQSLAPGRLVEHGTAPYENNPKNRDSYYVTLETEAGKQNTIWGVDLERAMKAAAPQIGDKIGLEHGGSQTVRLPDGGTAERHTWTVQSADALALKQLENRLSRSGVKETTLDYAGDFAERRGLSERFGIKSDIEIRPDREATAERIEGSSLARGSSQKVGEDLHPENRTVDLAQDRGDDRQQRSRFAGLKLGRGVAAAQPQQDRDGKKGPQVDPDRPQQTEKPRRGMFDGLKLNGGRGGFPGAQRGIGGCVAGAGQDRQADRLRPMSGFEQSVDRLARAWSAVERQDRQGLPVLEGQKAELQQAGQQLDQQRPGASQLMVSAMQYDPQTERAMHELSGRQRVGQLVAGMDRERALQADPNVRADRLINTWQELQSERQALRGWQHDEARGQVEGQMRKVAGSIERDPQVESIVRSRAQELGIASLQRDQKITQQMEQQLTRGRDLGLER